KPPFGWLFCVWERKPAFFPLISRAEILPENSLFPFSEILTTISKIIQFVFCAPEGRLDN
ncbi:TPA: hypothetical protein ACJI8U_002788, partial [Morganella morganii]